METSNTEVWWGRFNFRKLNELEFRKKYQTEVKTVLQLWRT